MKQFWIGVLCLTCTWQLTTAQESLSLQEAVSVALEKNFDIRIARNEAAVAKQQNSAGEAGMLPQIMLNLDQSNSLNNIRQEFINGNTLENPSAGQQALNMSVQMNWTVFDGLGMFTNQRRLNELEKLGALQARAMVEQVMAEVTMTYYEVVQRMQQMLLAEKSVAISRERMELAQQRYELGSSSRMEFLQARVDFNADQTAYLQQVEQLQQSKIELNKLLGRDVTLNFLPADTLPVLVELDYARLRQQAEKQNTWLTVAGMNQEIARLNRQLIGNQMLPRIDVLGGYHINRLQSEAGFLASNQNRGLDFGVRATMPVFDGFRMQRQRQIARIHIENAELVFEQQKQDVMAGISATYTAYEHNRLLVAMESENLEVAVQNLDIAQERYRLGALPAIELREAQRQLVAAESRLIQARFLLMLNRTELLRLSGQLLD